MRYSSLDYGRIQFKALNPQHHKEAKNFDYRLKILRVNLKSAMIIKRNM